MKRYIVKDTCNNVIRRYSNYRSAFNYLIMCNRYDWKICREEMI